MNNFVKCHAAVQCVTNAAVSGLQNALQTWHEPLRDNLSCCSTPKQCPSNKKPTAKNKYCKECIQWGDEIEAACFPKSWEVSWKNMTPSNLMKDPIEIAKVFVFQSTDGQESNKQLKDFDSGSLLKIMMHFKNFHDGNMDVYNALKQVGEVYFASRCIQWLRTKL